MIWRITSRARSGRQPRPARKDLLALRIGAEGLRRQEGILVHIGAVVIHGTLPRIPLAFFIDRAARARAQARAATVAQMRGRDGVAFQRRVG